MKKIYLIVSREYLERVRKKSFIVVTLLMPLFMIGLMLAPSLMMLYGGGTEQKRVMVVDRSGVVADRLYSSPEVEYVDISYMTKAEACTEYNDESKAFGILYIGSVVDARDSVQLITNTSSSMILEENIANQISSIIEQDKLLSYNIENIDEILASVKTDITLSTYLNDGSGQEATMESTSSGTSYILGIILGMLLYMIIIIYGQMVLTSVVEEKASRVIDVMVTSCTPFQLMMGKILGIAAVAVTQIAIWAVLVISASKFLLPVLMPADAGDAMFSAIVGTIGDTGYLATLFTYMLLFILGGFLLYASLYAAAGSAVDSVQDGQQYNTIIMLPIILSIIVMMSVFNDPNSPLAFCTSLIPFTSPIVMMARIPFGIATWEILLSLGLLYATFIFTTWLASKIFRVGIFMHGKRPSWSELWRWIRGA